MSKSLSQLFKKKEQRTRKLWETEFNIVEQGLDEEQVVAFINSLINQNNNMQKTPIESLHSLIERAVTDAEGIAASIKMKAEEEAGDIIDQAKQGVTEGPEGKAEETKQAKVAQKQAKQAVKRTANEETKRKAEESQQADNQIAAESVLEVKDKESIQHEVATEVEGTLGEKTKDAPVLPEEETVVLEPTEPIKEELPVPLPREETPVREKPALIPITMDKEALYSGEVSLGITVPVNPAAVSKLYNYLQTTPDLKILYTRGSWDRGTTITVSLDKPLPIVGILAKIPGVVISPVSTQEDSLTKVTSSSLLGVNRKEATRIDLILSEG